MQKNDLLSKNDNNLRGLDTLSFLIILFLTFVLPLFFLSFFSLSVSVSKTILISILIISAFFLWLVSRLKDSNLVFPKSIVLGAGFVVVVSFLLPSLFIDVPYISLVGIAGEVGTFSSALILYLLMFLSSIYFQNQKRVFYLYLSVLSSALIVFLYQVARFVIVFSSISVDFLLRVTPDIIIGRWADTAILFGLTAIISLLSLELINIRRKLRFFLYLSLTLSLIVLFVVNMQLVWIVLGLFAVFISMYSIYFGKSRKGANDANRNISKTPIFVVAMSLFFIFSGGYLSNRIYSLLNIPQDVLRPTYSDTMIIAKETFSKNLIFGSGPNRFVNSWLLFKPDKINSSDAWNLDFNTGFGLIPSFIITTGLIGALAWLLFFCAFLYSGIKTIFFVKIEEPYKYTIISSFVLSLYLWIFSIFFISNVTLLFFTYLMTGIFIATLAQSKIIKNYNFSLLDDPKVGFVSILAIILLVMSSIFGGYVLLKKFLAIGYFQRSIIAFNVNSDIDLSQKNINKAIRLSPNDLYYRTLSEINITKLNIAIKDPDAFGGLSQEELKDIYFSAINNAITATETDKTNYINWLFLGRVYELLIPFGDGKELYENSKQSYDKALLLNPKNPMIDLLRGRLELAVGNVGLAKEYVSKAISKKTNYTEAIFLLSRIQADEGNMDDAILSAQAAAIASPNNIGVFFHLGLLRYRNEDYKEAISAFERAILINSNYSNAKYFLGLSYDKEGQKGKAIQQFEDIKVLNPDNKDVQKILDNLKKGNRALSGITSPIDSENLPAEENLPIDDED